MNGKMKFYYVEVHIWQCASVASRGGFLVESPRVCVCVCNVCVCLCGMSRGCKVGEKVGAGKLVLVGQLLTSKDKDDVFLFIT